MTAGITPEMLRLGVAAMVECKKRRKSNEDIVAAVYEAMLAAHVMRLLRGESEQLH